MHGQANTAKQVRNGIKQAPARGDSSVQRQVARKQEECAISALNTGVRKMAASGVLRRCRRCAQLSLQAGRGDLVSCRSMKLYALSACEISMREISIWQLSWSHGGWASEVLPHSGSLAGQGLFCTWTSCVAVSVGAVPLSWSLVG